MGGVDGVHAEHNVNEIDDLDDSEVCPDVSLQSDEEEPVKAVIPDESTWISLSASCYSFTQVIYSLSNLVRSDPLEKDERFRKKKDKKIIVAKYALENKL